MKWICLGNFEDEEFSNSFYSTYSNWVQKHCSPEVAERCSLIFISPVSMNDPKTCAQCAFNNPAHRPQMILCASLVDLLNKTIQTRCCRATRRLPTVSSMCESISSAASPVCFIFCTFNVCVQVSVCECLHTLKCVSIITGLGRISGARWGTAGILRGRREGLIS